MLVTAGRLFPSTTVPVTLCATDAEGRPWRRRNRRQRNQGAHPVHLAGARKPRNRCRKRCSPFCGADLILLAPGSLYTSTPPNLLIPELRRALQQTNALILYVANLMTESRRNHGVGLGGHLRAILDIGGVRPTAVLVNDSPPSPGGPGPLPGGRRSSDPAIGSGDRGHSRDR
ncbi:MAG: YvcK family protein [Holophagaceae bacterium]|nr:YvcK family protein [Holophagaceae bacterium]